MVALCRGCGRCRGLTPGRIAALGGIPHTPGALRAGSVGSLAGRGPHRVPHSGRSMSSLEPHSDIVVEDHGLGVAGAYAVKLPVFEGNLDVVIYTVNVEGLSDSTVDAGYLDIGAAVSLTDAMTLIIGHYPTLEELFVRFASPPIRNAATLGGNIANGSPIGDSMPALMVLDTELVLNTGGEKRVIPMADFYLGYQQSDLKPGEFLERIRIPLPVDGEHVQSYKVSKRFDQDISAVCAAYRLRLDGGKVAQIKIAYGGMAAIPARALQCEQSLLGHQWNEESIDRAMLALDRDFSPISDMRSSGEYRQQICKNLLKRFYLESGDTAVARVYSFGR